MKKRLLALLVVTALIASLAGCGSKSDSSTSSGAKSSSTQETTSQEATQKTEATPVKLKVWAPENQIQPGTMKSMTESFQKLHPEWDIDFTIETQGEDTAKDEILKDVSAAGDVFFFANDQLNE